MESIKYTTYNEPFRRYVESMVKKRGCTYQELLDGLCTEKEWNEYCYEDRLMGLLLTERIIERLGGHIGNYEYLVFSDEYDKWKKRMEIVFAIEDGELVRAKGILEAYHAGRDKLERQFCLMMKAELMKCEGTDKKELMSVFKTAAKLTIPGGINAELDKRILSVQEINILLEYNYVYAYIQNTCNAEYEKCLDRIREMITYIKLSKWDDVLVAKIYPKALLYLLNLENKYSKSIKENHKYAFDDTIYNLTRLYNLIESIGDAIEALGKVGRSYYLAELLDIQADVLRQMEDIFELREFERLGYDERIEFTQRLQKTLEYIEKLTGVCRYMKSDTYMYVEMSVFRLEEAVTSRRKMMGMSQSDLADGICDAKTIGRFERGEHITRGYIVYDILRKVKLYSDFIMGSVIAFSTEEHVKVQEINALISQRRLDEAEKKLLELKEILDISYERNLQTVERQESLIRLYRGELTQTEYIDELKMIIGYTVNYDRVGEEKVGYLTGDELLLIQNMACLVKNGKEINILCSQFVFETCLLDFKNSNTVLHSRCI